MVLNHLSLEDTYEGDFETLRVLRWTLTFTMKAWFMGNSQYSSIIKLPQTTINPQGTFKFTPYTDSKNWMEITIDDADNIKWYEEFTDLTND